MAATGIQRDRSPWRSLVKDRQQAIFMAGGGATMPFCCQACFARACQEQVRRHQIQAAKDPLERLGHVPQDAF